MLVLAAPYLDLEPLPIFTVVGCEVEEFAAMVFTLAVAFGFFFSRLLRI